jgi:lysophospholipase L1-like esterase
MALHPSAQGYQKLAAGIEPTLCELLKDRCR